MYFYKGLYTFSLLFLLNIAVGTACLAIGNPPSVVNSKQLNYGALTDTLFKVIKVIDGDTFWVEGNSRRFKVRFIGVDAPEIRNSTYKKKGYYATEAKEFVRCLTEGKFVRLVYDVQGRDRYQRDLAYVYLEDGTFLNAALLRGGYAMVATFPPNVRHVDYFLKLQRKARKEKIGLWAKEL